MAGDGRKIQGARCKVGKFQELNVWQRAKDLAVYIYRAIDQGKLGKDYGLPEQIRRAAVSISSHIVGADELDTDRQSVKHFYVAKGSSAEVLKRRSSLSKLVTSRKKRLLNIYVEVGIAENSGTHAHAEFVVL